MQRPKAPELVVSLAAAALFVGAAVGFLRDGQDGGATGGPREVVIEGFAFGPDVLTVSTGDTVTWTNADGTTHTVTGDQGNPDSPDLDGGSSYEATFDETGSFEYVCKFHPNMQGTIVVEG
jgi:plastocyanin